MGAASILDAAALAWKPPGELASAAPGARTPSIHWIPTAGVAHDAGRRVAPTLGIAGSF
jgi:hypothetical protein